MALSQLQIDELQSLQDAWDEASEQPGFLDVFAALDYTEGTKPFEAVRKLEKKGYVREVADEHVLDDYNVSFVITGAGSTALSRFKR